MTGQKLKMLLLVSKEVSGHQEKRNMHEKHTKSILKYKGFLFL
jgi:hypothetical protein